MELTPIPLATETFSQAIDGTGDTEILTAFEALRAARATIYSYDDVEPGISDEESARLDLISQEAEPCVYSNWATTLPGVASRLMLAIPAFAEDRWIDSDLMQHGLLSIYNQRKLMDHRVAQVTQAAYELMHIQWDLALAAYNQSEQRFTDALALKSFVETEIFRLRDKGATATKWLVELEQRVSKLEDDACNNREVNDLLATPAPDLLAYKCKVEIAIKEGLERQVAPHLVQDANFLFAAYETRSTAKEA